MGFLDKAKGLGKKTVDVSVKAGKKGVEVGKRGGGAFKRAINKKVCPECKYYAPIDETQGDCPIGGRRLATADIATCPQKAYISYEVEQEQSQEGQDRQYEEQPASQETYPGDQQTDPSANQPPQGAPQPQPGEPQQPPQNP
jgi:hypothetical protein